MMTLIEAIAIWLAASPQDNREVVEKAEKIVRKHATAAIDRETQILELSKPE